MKAIAFALCFVSFSSIAATVKSARIDETGEYLAVDVVYGGGCAKHTFSLQLELCKETYPVSCDAKLVETIEGGVDFCEALVPVTALFKLSDYGLNESYFSKGRLTIKGDLRANGKPSSATVVLP